MRTFSRLLIRRHSVEHYQCFRAKCFRGSARADTTETVYWSAHSRQTPRATPHLTKDAVRSSIAGGAEEKACVITKVVLYSPASRAIASSTAMQPTPSPGF